MFSFNNIEWLALQRYSFSKPRKILQQLQEGIFEKTPLDLSQAKKDWLAIERLGFEMIVWNSDRYPKILKEIYDPPLVLLTKGKWDLWEKKLWVAVVGARKATEVSRNKVRELIPKLVQQGFGIVSGLAYGIDAEAHRASVAAGGVTWGVLGSGIDSLYPTSHKNLAEQMTGKGGYLSEFPLGTPPFPGYFPQRNRIISGLSQAVIVVQANFKSGSLITARFALEQGRDVFVVPPPDESVAYEGNKKLLEEGAIPFECAEQLWDGVTIQQNKAPPIRDVDSTATASPLLSFLKSPVSLETLTRKTRKNPKELLAELIQLEAEGFVRKKPGALWQSL